MQNNQEEDEGVELPQELRNLLNQLGHQGPVTVVLARGDDESDTEDESENEGGFVDQERSVSQEEFVDQGRSVSPGASMNPKAVLQGIQELLTYYRVAEVKSDVKEDEWSIVVGMEPAHFLNRLELSEHPQQAFLAFLDEKLACANVVCQTFSQMYAQFSMGSTLRMRKDVLNNMFRTLDQMNGQYLQCKRRIVELVEEIGAHRRGCNEQRAVEFVRRINAALDGLKQFVAMTSVRLSLQDTVDVVDGVTEIVQHFKEFRQTLMNNILSVVGSVDSWHQEPFMRRAQPREMMLLLLQRRLTAMVRRAGELLECIERAHRVSCALAMRDARLYEVIVRNMGSLRSNEFVKIPK